MYREFASWWHILSEPAHYADEARFVRKLFLRSRKPAPRTIVEFGSGGGNNAAHLKKHFQMTLVDKSRGMLKVSRALNPECEHLLGDMRTMRLGREFDGVFIHDAIMYMTTQRDLLRAMQTAYVHCKPRGIAVFVPDRTRETFQPKTHHGGHDGKNRAMRYLDWTYDPNPRDSTFISDVAYLLRENGKVRVAQDRHVMGIFSHADWMRLLRQAGFMPKMVIDQYQREVFVGLKK